MSWDSYIDNIIAQSGGHCDKVCIIDKDTGAAWTSAAHASGIKLAPGEESEVVKGLKNPSKFQCNGVTLENEKYRFLRNDDEGLCLFKKKDCGAITIMPSQKAIVIGHTKEGGQQGNTNKGVCAIADHLKASGY